MAISPVPMYVGWLEAIGCDVNADSFVSFIHPDGEMAPVTVGSKRLVVPTPDVLKRMDAKQHIAYHPLSEMITRSESQVQQKIRTIINVKTLFIAVGLMIDLVALAASDKKESTSKSEYFPLFAALKDVTPKTLEAVSALADKLQPTGVENRLINFASKRNGTIAGSKEKRRRVTTVTFPILHEFGDKSDPGRIYGVKMSKKDKLVIYELLKFIFPKMETPDAYSAASDSMQAPYFMSLAEAHTKLMAEALNPVAWTFKDSISNFSYSHAQVGWFAQTEQLKSYEGFIPSMEGNEGLDTLKAKDGSVVANVGEISPSIFASPVTSAVQTATIPVAPSPAQVKETPSILKSPGISVGLNALNTMGNGGSWNGGGFATVQTGHQGGYVHPNGTVGLNTSYGMGNTGFGGVPAYGNNGGAYVPPGFVAGKNGQVFDILNTSLDVLEQNLDTPTFNDVYQFRMNHSTQNPTPAAYAHSLTLNVVTPAFGYGNGGFGGGAFGGFAGFNTV